MPQSERLLLSRPDAPWLPPAGRADVIAVVPGTITPPEPTCLVRLLATRAGRIHVCPRPDGRGLDIPTRRRGALSIEESLRDLLAPITRAQPPRILLGYVRNTVAEPAGGYEWPTPEAYFAVWHCERRADDDVVEGVWLDRARARVELGERHWWPLTALLDEDVLG